jgi:hypothetical protein
LSHRSPETGLDVTSELADQEMYKQKALRKSGRRIDTQPEPSSLNDERAGAVRA